MVKIAIHGLGYVGLVSAVCLAKGGNNKIIGYEVDPKKINMLKRGEAYIYEIGMKEYLEDALNSGRFIPTDDFSLTTDAEIDLICVGTPSAPDGSADLKYVESVAKEIGKNMKGYKVIATKSTVPVNTHKKVAEWVREGLEESKTKSLDTFLFDVASIPEFLKEGDAINDFEHPDRIIVGTYKERAAKILQKLFQRYVNNGHPIFNMNPGEAEMSKYAANTRLALQIAYMEELSQICDALGIDVMQVRQGMGSDKRIGMSFTYPGPGYGGSCFPKDVQALNFIAKEAGIETKLIGNIHRVNEDHKEYLVRKVLEQYGGDLSGKTFALWGLTFKAETDDVRESASLKMVGRLTYHGAKVHCFDPKGRVNFEQHFPRSNKVKYFKSKETALRGSDALVVMTEWDDFKEPEIGMLEQKLKDKTVFDFRNLYYHNGLDLQLKEKGFTYLGVGRR